MKFAFRFTIILLTLIGFNSAFCQDAIDSLEQLYITESNKDKQIDLLIELSKTSLSTNFEKSLSYSSAALKKINALEQTDENLQKKSLIENIIGVNYLYMGKYDKSLQHCLASLKIAEEIQDSSRMSASLNNLGLIYGYKNELEKSNDYFLESAKIDEALGNLSSSAISYSNIASSYFGMDDYENGKIYYDKSMEIYKEIGDDDGIASLYLINGRQLEKKKKYKDALKYYDLAISIYESYDNTESLLTSYQYKANLYSKVNKRNEAITFYKKNLELALKLNSAHNISMAYEGLSGVYETMGNMGKALEYYKYHVQWNDTVFNQNSENVIAEMQAKYNYEKEERENKILKQEAAISQLELENNKKRLQSSRIIIFSTIGGAILLLLLAFVLYKQNKLKEETNAKLIEVNNEISEAKLIIEEKNKDITDSIEYAKYIQHAILPKKESVIQCFDDAFLLLMPKDVVSGDFYWFQKYGDYAVIVMADCTGHGVPGGFMSMMGIEMLNQVLGDPSVMQAGQALEEINKRICNNLNKAGSERQQRDGMDLSICIFNRSKNTVQYAGANRPLILIRNGEPELIKPNKYGVGGSLEENKKFTNHEFEVLKGDQFYMFSDGYPDQFGGPKNKKFMRKRFTNILVENAKESMQMQEKNLISEFNNWKGELEQIDDVCVVGVRI
ncbi:MAG: tetratricopeptide repeat protein [Putridiphycobacter sp.]